MENSYKSCSSKYLKTSPHTTLHSTAGEVGRHIHLQESFKLDYEADEQQQKRVHDKPKVAEKLPMNEKNKPLELTLPTQLGEVKHPGFNYMQMVAAKMYLLEQEKQLEKKVQKIIEEEEVRRSRNEMIAKAQLMLFCERPFFPQRSIRPLPVPEEPNFHFMNNKCWGCLSGNALTSFETLRSKL